jgi:hypothetical protein
MRRHQPRTRIHASARRELARLEERYGQVLPVVLKGAR